MIALCTRNVRTRWASLLIVGLLLGLGSCRTVRRMVPGSDVAPRRIQPEKIEAALARAENDLAEGRSEKALEWMQAARDSDVPNALQRNRIQELYERAAASRLEELSTPGSNPRDLDDLLELDVPRQISVTAAVRAAKFHLENDDPLDAFRLIKRLDEKYPLHHERAEAGRVVSQAGFDVLADKSKFLGLFSKRDRAPEVFEYLVLNYPSEPTCANAYAALAEIYQEDLRWELAIERLQDLLLYHPQSEIAPLAEAHIPHLRLISVSSPEYDRRELLVARDELRNWLERHPGHEMEEVVGIDLADCLLRLHASDMNIARFYLRVENEAGARLHAQRAEESARLAGATEEAQISADFLAALPPDDLQSEADFLEERSVSDSVTPEDRIDEILEERVEGP